MSHEPVGELDTGGDKPASMRPAPNPSVRLNISRLARAAIPERSPLLSLPPRGGVEKSVLAFLGGGAAEGLR